MAYAPYQDYFIDPEVSERQLVGVGYGQEAEQCLSAAYGVVSSRKVGDLHDIATFIEQEVFLRAAELQQEARFRRVVSDPWPEVAPSEAIRNLRSIAGDLNLWLQIAPKLAKRASPCGATDVEMMAILCLWKGQAQGRVISQIVALMREAGGPTQGVSDPREHWAPRMVEITRLWEMVVDLGSELGRAATLATSMVDKREETRRAGRAGADKRALGYLPARERAQALYRQGSYRSRNKAAEDIFRRLSEEGFKVAFSSVLSYLTDLDKEIEASRDGNSSR